MTTKSLVVAIDAPNTDLFDSWVAEGRLPQLAALAAAGVTGRHSHTKRFRNDRCWDLFLSGSEIGGCGSTFVPETYGYFNDSLQREDRFVPFYARSPGLRACIFDLPATLVPGLDGIQVSGWGSELNASRPISMPPGLMAELLARHGPDPKLAIPLRVRDIKSGEDELSYVLPSLYDRAAVLDFKARLLTSVERRTAIALDLLARGDWDMFFGIYPESHTANHILWHLGENHPLAEAGTGHAQLEILQAVDAALGRLHAAAPAADTLVFSIDHTGINAMDVPGMALLPELLYRWCFSGRQALAPGVYGAPVPALRRDYRAHWKHEVWDLRTAAGNAELQSPASQEAEGDALSWNPANWYRPLWPGMKAFALPSVADGYVRLNVRGREACGQIAAADFQSTLAELGALLSCTTNPRTGHPLVKRVIATREQPNDHPEIPVDLIVCWDDRSPADTLDSPDLGRIGPLPYFRTGGHVSHGSEITNRWFAAGPQVMPGSATEDGGLPDLAATILHMAGGQIPADIQGRPLFANRRDLASSS